MNIYIYILIIIVIMCLIGGGQKDETIEGLSIWSLGDKLTGALNTIGSMGGEIATAAQSIGDLGGQITSAFASIGHLGDQIAQSFVHIVDIKKKIVAVEDAFKQTKDIFDSGGDIVKQMAEIIQPGFKILELGMAQMFTLVKLLIIILKRMKHCATGLEYIREEGLVLQKKVQDSFNILENNILYCKDINNIKEPYTYYSKCLGNLFTNTENTIKLIGPVKDFILNIKKHPALWAQDAPNNQQDIYGKSAKYCVDQLKKELGKSSSASIKYVGECNQCLNLTSIIQLGYSEILEVEKLMEDMKPIMVRAEGIMKDIFALIESGEKLGEDILIIL